MEYIFGFSLETALRVYNGRELKAEDKPLTKVAEAFRDLAATIDKDREVAMQVASFSHACSLVNALIDCLGFAFRVAEQDLETKVNDIAEASKMMATLPELIDADIKANTAKQVGSHTRNLLRVNRGLEMLKVLFQEMLANEGDSMIPPAMTAYGQVFGPYHSLAEQSILTCALPTIPTRSQLVSAVHEDGEGLLFCFC